MKILMIGPAAAESRNYGFGLATESIAHQLSGKTDLTIISPVAADTLEEEKSNKKRSIQVKKELLDARIIEATAVHINVSAALQAYLYHTPQPKVTTEEIKIQEEIQLALERYNTQILHEVNTLKYDLIYAHDWLSIGAALQLQAKYKKPFILHIHALDYDRVGKKSNSWIYKLEKQGMEKADKVIAVSHYHARIMEQEYGIAPEKISVVHLGSEQGEANAFKSPFEEDIILFAGRLSHQKGIFTFIEIAKALIEDNDQLRFVIAGDGELSSELVSKVNEMGLSEHVNFTGLIEREELNALMKVCKAIIIPSVSEPFGLIALEAAHNELPLVLSPNCGASELLTKAFVPKTAKVKDYVDQVNLILTGKEAVIKSVKENKEAALLRNWEKVGNEILKVLSS